jgi:hypothetical protein
MSIELIAKVAPMGGGFVGMVDANQVIGGGGSGVLPDACMPDLTGEVTTVAGAVATTITAKAVTLAKMADMATASFLGRTTALAGTPEVLSVGTVQTMLGLGTGAYATIANYALVGQTMYLGTTQVAINRGSGALALAGVSVDGSSGSCTGASATCTGNAGSATYASTVALVDDVATAAEMDLLWATGTTGNYAAKTSAAKLHFNPSTGLLTATGFGGPLTGDVTGNCSGSSGTCSASALTSPTNLVRNGGAEDGTTYWYKINDVGSDGDISAYAADFYSGSASLRFVRTVKGGWGSIFYNQLNEYLPSPYFNTGLQYTINFWTKSLSGAARTLSVMISDVDGTDVVANFGAVTIPTAWTRFSFTFTPALAGVAPVLYFGPVEDAIDVLIDNVQLNVGTQALGYCGLQMDCNENAFIAGTLDVRGAYAFLGALQGYSYFYQDSLNFGYTSNANYAGWINYCGYGGGATQYRDLTIGDGKNNAIAFFDGSTGHLALGYTTAAARLHVYPPILPAAHSARNVIVCTDLYNAGANGQDIALTGLSAAGVPVGWNLSSNWNGRLSFGVWAGGYDTAPNEYLTILTGGGVGIGTITIPHGGIGLAKFAIDGTDASAAGPHVQFTTATDDYPLMQIEPWSHDAIVIAFDAYFDGANKSSNATSNYRFLKNGSFYLQYDSGIAQGAAITWNDGIVLNTSGNVGIGTAAPGGLLDLSKGTAGVTSDLLLKYTWSTDATNWGMRLYQRHTGGEIVYDWKIRNGAAPDINVLTFLSTGYVGRGTTAPTSPFDLEHAGTVTADVNFLEITNTANAAAMTGTRTSIFFRQFYYDVATPAVADAAKITLCTESHWTSDPASQSASMAFFVNTEGTLELSLTLTGLGATVTGRFGCNGQPQRSSYAAAGALDGYVTGAFGLDSGAHMAAMHELVSDIYAALVANGIMS